MRVDSRNLHLMTERVAVAVVITWSGINNKYALVKNGAAIFGCNPLQLYPTCKKIQYIQHGCCKKWYFTLFEKGGCALNTVSLSSAVFDQMWQPFCLIFYMCTQERIYCLLFVCRRTRNTRTVYLYSSIYNVDIHSVAVAGCFANHAALNPIGTCCLFVFVYPWGCASFGWLLCSRVTCLQKKNNKKTIGAPANIHYWLIFVFMS